MSPVPWSSGLKFAVYTWKLAAKATSRQHLRVSQSQRACTASPSNARIPPSEARASREWRSTPAKATRPSEARDFDKFAEPVVYMYRYTTGSSAVIQRSAQHELKPMMAVCRASAQCMPSTSMGVGCRFEAREENSFSQKQASQFLCNSLYPQGAADIRFLLEAVTVMPTT
ncbi:uncharacterized protein PGTG_13393 [Puccinia graminis f. sp. tritici CRL 75-36-700-3]|uniref:Uncharacterized protein n=1 Tax=Puccinia graminis f. sp. tritici (strain CRL 75-36-700-3 / race SCCL) TaxID=418459 RepID=E3KS99_PUCGT|nr:uncharacterized protein PGTG_13393 [Puccinia graminis f. sp. tritici CRL 75-36-700-3]EFP87174.1 hypothetical protein PGTG_13393 [Puccinia graminis f. sp. tritici CRL 75-36-700-3]